jgi:pilus assembly protein Flp/PilA
MLNNAALQTIVFVQNAVARLRDEERGATATEYAMLVGLIAIVVAGAMSIFAGYLGGKFSGFSW